MKEMMRVFTQQWKTNANAKDASLCAKATISPVNLIGFDLGLTHSKKLFGNFIIPFSNWHCCQPIDSCDFQIFKT